MKKITLFIMSMFVMGVTQAQSIGDFSAVMPITDNNMSVVFPAGTLSDYPGGLIQAFVGIVPVSDAAVILSDGSGGAAVIGTDALCGCDLATAGDQITFYINYLGVVYLISDVTPPATYTANALHFVDASGLVFTEVTGYGCLNSNYEEYDSSVSANDNSFCITWYGCMNSSYVEFNENATVEETNSCSTLLGCTDANYDEFNSEAGADDGSCVTLLGCMDTAYAEFDADAAMDTDPTSCVSLYGCTDADYDEYTPEAGADDGSCVTITGCTNSLADSTSFNPAATIDTDPSMCVFTGCMDTTANNYDSIANNAGYCQFLGCMDDAACNFDASANEDDASCSGLVGCIDALYLDFSADAMCAYNEAGTADCGELIIPGCTNPSADNYEPLANFDDGSCESTGVNPDAIVTSNNMSVLITATGNVDSTTLASGDLLFAVYETARLENELVGYSGVSGIKSAGSVVWSEATSIGIAVFGADANSDNGYQEFEDLVWLIKSGGIVYNATITYNDDFDGLYDAGEYVQVASITRGTPYYVGCMNAEFANYAPLATTDPDNSCAEPFSIGCMDVTAVNFAGVGANPTHDNATNFDDAFVENLTLNLNTGISSSSNTAALSHDQSMCQTQIEGCTDAMASNYDSQATQNDKTICDWTLNGMTEYNVDANGIMDTDGVVYNFGAVASNNENDGLVDSDFDNAQLLFDEGYLTPSAHVIDNLADVMQWIDMDEERDFIELNDTIEDMQARYDANDLMWLTTYTDTLSAVEAWFAADEAADAHELLDTVTDMQARYEANDLMWLTTYTDTLSAVEAWFAADEAADAAYLDSTEVSDDAILALTISDMQDAYDANEAMWVDYTAATLKTSDSLLAVTNDTLEYHRAPLVIDLHSQWNTIAYYLHHESPVVAQFANQFGGDNISVAEHINIVKNNEGLFYWPQFSFDGIGMLVPGQGYQVRVANDIDGVSQGKSDFIFEHSINADAYRTLIPTVPAWAIDMEVQNHPNDIRTLVRVVNMLGQEVNPANQFNGEVLLYMYNDGTVEKKMVQ